MQPAMPTQLNWYRGNSIVRGASQRTAVQRVRAPRQPSRLFHSAVTGGTRCCVWHGWATGPRTLQL